MQLPPFLQPFETDALRYLKEGRVQQIEFSGETYQVQVLDEASEQEYWTFLQFDPAKEALKDSFCSCEEMDTDGCVHLAAAYLRIFNDTQKPLHQRFKKSLWNALCFISSIRLGMKRYILTKTKSDGYECRSASNKLVFGVRTNTPEARLHLEELLAYPVNETEETSLKFSNLSEEEITLWREGRPSEQLAYELSFWNDIAKWLMMLQDKGEDYEIQFQHSPQGIPNRITAKFQDLEVEFYLSQANLPLIIPSLATVKSPLAVHNAQQHAIDKITYNKKERCLNIIGKSIVEQHTKQSQTAACIQLDGWSYKPGDGFYALDQYGLLSIPKACGNKVSMMLNQHLPTIKKLLEDVAIHEDPVQVSYQVAFDSLWNLHVSSYLFEPGDLTEGFSQAFGDWAYLDDDGFYRLEVKQFPEARLTIPQDDVAQFVTKNRAWLNTQDGFHTHLTSIEAQLIYTVSPDRRLTFHRKISLQDENATSKDFGAWVYVTGQGFYSKVSSHIGLPVRPGISLSSDQVPLFIRMNEEELKLVPKFFSAKCPIEHSGLRVELGDKDVIQVIPEYDLLPGYHDKQIHFFDDFVYLDGEGFYELPHDARLPEKYRQPTELHAEDIELVLEYELELLEKYATHFDERLVKPAQLQLVPESVTIDHEGDPGWYLMQLGYRSEQGYVPLQQLLQAIKQKKRYAFTKAGLIDLHEERFNWLNAMRKNRFEKRSNTLALSTLEVIRLNAFEPIFVDRKLTQNYDQAVAILRDLNEFGIPTEPDISYLNSQLRPYQTLGIHWLWFLYAHKLSGLLCDDMGLGKTHQAMALIAAIMKERESGGKRNGVHFLIVCPTSVIFHWEEKIQQFLPRARVCTFYGFNRSLEEFHKQYDILLTTYGIWRNENELLGKVPFELAIFDEIQVAKNQSSKVHAALLNVDAVMRLGLTGTPIENHLRELKSLFDIVLPTYMPGDKDYRDFFVKPIEKEHDRAKKELLSRFIKPFVLRRKKQEVLIDLPSKTEEVSHCMLLPEQRTLYAETLQQSRTRLLQQLQDEQTPIPYVHVFALLSSLKQICNHPAIFLKEPDKYKEHESGKWNLFVELLGEARQSQQKVVIFSQYLFMLDIMQLYLQEQDIGYATIRGSTQNRGEEVRRFNNDPLCEVFLGSLQASGVGIDLTAGSVVIHYDRWWNAARENQATDRIHRIGQMRGVQVFKMVTKDTFEEKIDEMITRKGQFLEEIVEADDHRILKHFNRQEIIEMLQFVEKGKEKNLDWASDLE